jgi:hypothetical protein
MPDIELFFFRAAQNYNVFLVAIQFRVDPVCGQPKGKVVTDLLAAIKERRAWLFLAVAGLNFAFPAAG